MSKLTILSAIFMVALLGTTEGIQCNEGFNISLGGIPFYQWSESTCNANSECFGQELRDTVGVDVTLAYGACISNSYASLLNCDSLFGDDSILDPAQLLDLIPDIEQQITALVQDFIKEGLEKVINMFTADGADTETFISGIFTFYENIGLNMEKFKPLAPSIAKLLRASVNAVNDTDNTAITAAYIEFLTAVSNLDTENTEFEDAIYELLRNFMTTDEINQLKNNPAIAPIIKKMPGLIKSMFPSSWQSELWYDLSIKLLGNIDVKNPKQTTIDAIETIKNTLNIPPAVDDLLDPIFKSLPDLVEKLAEGNLNYTGLWLLDLLPSYSERDDATRMLDEALITFVETISGDALPDEFKKMIQWLPGLFYKVIPTEKTAIGNVYKKMAEGFKSFKWDDLTDTSPETKLSGLILGIISGINVTEVTAPVRAMIINFSYMFYDLMDGYTDELDRFVQVFIDGFNTWPNINAGEIITNLIVEFGATVPSELKPLLDHFQGVITAATAVPLNPETLLNSFTTVIDEYETKYPDSPFPVLVKQLLDNLVAQITLDYSKPESANQAAQLQLQLVYWQIDLQFALFGLMDVSSHEFTQAIIDAFPEYEVYIKVMQAVDPEDVKQLIKDTLDWAVSGAVSGDTLTAASFVSATKETFEKITASISGIMKDIRKIFRPAYCKFGSCSTDLCNTHGYIASQQEVVYKAAQMMETTAPALADEATTAPMKTPTPTSTTTPSTTTGAATFSPSLLLTIATVMFAFKTLVE